MARSITAIIAALLLLSACGGASVIRGEPPRVSISTLIRTQGGLELQLRFRNVNQEPLSISQVAFTFTLEDHDFRVQRTSLPLSIDASTSEVHAFPLTLPASVELRLQALEDGELASLEHRIEGEIIDREGEDLKFSVRGHLYAVPGRPGQFR